MDLHIGATILDRDGEGLGKLTHVIVDPKTDEVAEIVLGERGLLGRDVIVPVGAVNSASRDEIHLELSKEQADKLQDFAVSNFIAPPPEAFAGYPWAGAALVGQGLAPVGAATGLESIAYTPVVETAEQIPEGDVDLEPGTEVWASDGKVGTVRDVLVDDQTKRVRGFVIQEGLVFHKSVEVSMDEVATIGADRVTLKVSKAELSTE